MRQTIAALMAVVVVVGTLAVAPAVGAVVQNTDAQANVQDGTNETDSNETDSNATISPGERLSGVIGVQEAEIEGEIDSRSFGLAVARASSDEARAALIAAEVNETGQELSELEAEREELREARQNGSISEGQFRARMAELVTRGQNVERQANATANASQGLPAELLEANGVNATAIETLRSQARNLTGPETAAIARNIAGNAPSDRGQAGERSQAGDRGENATERDREREQAGDRGQAGDRDGNQTDAPSGDDTPQQGGDRTTDSEQTTEQSTDETTETPESDDERRSDGSDQGGSGGDRGGNSGR